MSLRVRFATLAGPFKVETEERTFPTLSAALEAVAAHACAAGYTNVKAVEDVDSLRFTARTPGGRGGRNVAFADYVEEAYT